MAGFSVLASLVVQRAPYTSNAAVAVQGAELLSLASGAANFSALVFSGAMGAQASLAFGLLNQPAVARQGVAVRLTRCPQGEGWVPLSAQCVAYASLSYLAQPVTLLSANSADALPASSQTTRLASIARSQRSRRVRALSPANHAQPDCIKTQKVRAHSSCANVLNVSRLRVARRANHVQAVRAESSRVARSDALRRGVRARSAAARRSLQRLPAGSNQRGRRQLRDLRHAVLRQRRAN